MATDRSEFPLLHQQVRALLTRMSTDLAVAESLAKRLRELEGFEMGKGTDEFGSRVYEARIQLEHLPEMAVLIGYELDRAADLLPDTA